LKTKTHTLFAHTKHPSCPAEISKLCAAYGSPQDNLQIHMKLSILYTFLTHFKNPEKKIHQLPTFGEVGVEEVKYLGTLL